jgi:hypothetical protein
MKTQNTLQSMKLKRKKIQKRERERKLPMNNEWLTFAAFDGGNFHFKAFSNKTRRNYCKRPIVVEKIESTSTKKQSAVTNSRKPKAINKSRDKFEGSIFQ